jgi:hypothetical protein
MRKTGVLFLVVTLVILLYCAGSGTAATGMQAERVRSAKPQVSQVSSGSDFTAAVKADGTLWTWGYDQRAARGINTFRPGQVGSDTNWSTVSAGGNQISAVIAALKSDGTLWTWSWPASWDLWGLEMHLRGPIAPMVPGQVGKDRDWASVSVGGAHIAALKKDGTLWTWGANMHGQLGDGTLPVGDRARYSPFRNAPTVVSLAPDNGAEARPGAPKMVRIYPRARINDPAALGGELVPFLENGRTMLPLRFLGEQLGAVVRFDSAKKEVTIAKGTVTVQLRLGEKAARISQEGAVPRTVALDVPARAVHGRTVVPLRFVSEALGATVIRTEDGGSFVLQ